MKKFFLIGLFCLGSLLCTQDQPRARSVNLTKKVNNLNREIKDIKAEIAELKEEIRGYVQYPAYVFGAFTLLAGVLGSVGYAYLKFLVKKRIKKEVDKVKAKLTALQKDVERISVECKLSLTKETEEGLNKIKELFNLLVKKRPEEFTTEENTILNQTVSCIREKPNKDLLAIEWHLIASSEINEAHYDKANSAFLSALALEPENTVIMGYYANFLRNNLQDYPKAEEFYKKTLELDPFNANNLVFYANFLIDIHQSYVEAEFLFKKALQINPKNIFALGNYAGLLLLIGRKEEGKTFLSKAEKEMTPNEISVLLECKFFRYAYFHEQDALKAIKHLITDGGRSPYWNFSPHIAKSDHPNRHLLETLSRVINNKLLPNELKIFTEWQNT